METTRRERLTVSLPAYAMAEIKRKAHASNRSASSVVATIILDSLYNEPNPDTLAALEEARSCNEMEELTPYDIEHFEEYVANI